MKRALTAALAALLLAAGHVSVDAHDPPRTKVTWNGDIARLVHARCVRCHAPDGRGPMSLVTYDDARPWAKAIREEVMARRMPKWHAARGYGQFANDPSLSAFEIAMFVSWVDGGSLRGPEPQTIDPQPAAPAAVAARQVTVPCANRQLPAGRLLAITPHLADDASAGFVARFPDGRREILGWIRNFDVKFPETYRLRTPLDLPAGSWLEVEGAGRCSVTLHVARS